MHDLSVHSLELTLKEYVDSLKLPDEIYLQLAGAVDKTTHWSFSRSFRSAGTSHSSCHQLKSQSRQICRRS